MSRWSWVGVGLLAMVLGCSGESETPPKPADPIKTPDPYRVKFETTKGDFVIKVRPDWAPEGAKRFRELVESGFYDGVKFFRVVDGFMAQFGISGDPEVSAQWRDRTIPDDAVRTSNQRGTISFATSGPNSRTTQVFINYVDNSRLDSMGFSPFGVVVEGMDVVDSLNSQYGESTTQTQGQIQMQGNSFLDANFPGLDEVKKATIVSEETVEPKTESDSNAKTEPKNENEDEDESEPKSDDASEDDSEKETE